MIRGDNPYIMCGVKEYFIPFPRGETSRKSENICSNQIVGHSPHPQTRTTRRRVLKSFKLQLPSGAGAPSCFNYNNSRNGGNTCFPDLFIDLARATRGRMRPMGSGLEFPQLDLFGRLIPSQRPRPLVLLRSEPGNPSPTSQSRAHRPRPNNAIRANRMTFRNEGP